MPRDISPGKVLRAALRIRAQLRHKLRGVIYEKYNKGSKAYMALAEEFDARSASKN